ncbi:hypothetical protein V6N13_026591 [Hibiscus sabdariffa]|uniref:Uncharacterized protein n=1 Tax=Hibiscus sabdariffa TaxID=183260 RepID=A0ABR2PEU2_9ROSI
MSGRRRYNNVQLDGKLMKVEIVGMNVPTHAAPSPAHGTLWEFKRSTYKLCLIIYLHNIRQTMVWCIKIGRWAVVAVYDEQSVRELGYKNPLTVAYWVYVIIVDVTQSDN